jgi:hypothetical protein
MSVAAIATVSSGRGSRAPAGEYCEKVGVGLMFFMAIAC